MDIKGASCIVTGGASGLGEATTRRFVEAGAAVVIADMNAEKGEALAAELGERCRFVQTNVADGAQVSAAIAAAQELGPLRAAVSCAGVGWAQRTVNREGLPHELDRFARVVQINLIGTFNVMRLCAAAMAKNTPQPHGERGVVINTASIAAFDGQIGQIAYAASKAGVAGMTLPAARDLSKAGVRVLTIAPGTFDTPMLGMLPEEARQALAAGIPFPAELGQPSQYAALALHMVENPYLNGETVRIDGALRMPPK
ncbi:MAG: SDR family NAD(P)-dependent oxidoreductase [Myxococcales bacterium]|nr:SDR family NAD(P)-dependent oxidoreductase [Myxococcales bacterium]